MSDVDGKMETVEPGETKDEADEELQRVCGSDHLSDLARRMWREMEKDKVLDASDQQLADDDVRKLMNGLHTIAKQTGYLTERMRPFPCETINFSGNSMTRVGCGEVVQFARTHGCNAKMVDLSHCQLDDVAATDELSRLVKNSGTWRGSSSFLNKLKLRGNRIGKNGASKLIQYAHWARVGYAAPKDELPPVFVIDLSDNVIDKPMDLAEDLVSKKIKVSTASEPKEDTTVHLPDFDDQRHAPPEPPPKRAGPGGGRPRELPGRRRDDDSRHDSRQADRGPPRGGSYSSGECWDFQMGRCFRGAACKFSHAAGGRADRGRDRGRDYGDDRRDRYSRSRERHSRGDRRDRGRDRRYDRDDSRDRRGRSDSRDRRARSDSRDKRARSGSRDRRARSDSRDKRARSDSRDKRARSPDKRARSPDKRARSVSTSDDRRSESSDRKPSRRSRRRGDDDY